MFKNISCCHSSKLSKIDSDRVIVGKQRGYIVNVGGCVIEKEVNDYKLGYVYCLLILGESMVLMGNGRGFFCVYDVRTGEYSMKENNHEMNICDLVKLDEYTFASCSVDKVVQTWRC